MIDDETMRRLMVIASHASRTRTEAELLALLEEAADLMEARGNLEWSMGARYAITLMSASSASRRAAV